MEPPCDRAEISDRNQVQPNSGERNSIYYRPFCGENSYCSSQVRQRPPLA
jgi:hypothetical protein